MSNSCMRQLGLLTLASLVLASTSPAFSQDSEQGGGTVTKRRTLIESTTKSSDKGTAGQSQSESEKVVKKPAYKYKERFNNYDEQIQMGLTKGWLTEAEGKQFKTELSRLRDLEKSAEKKGYPKEETDSLEKQVTKFNSDLSTASSKPKPAAKAGTTGSPAAATKKNSTTKAGTTGSPAAATKKSSTTKAATPPPKKNTVKPKAESPAPKTK